MRLQRLLWLAPVMMTGPGCVLSLSPLPASYGPPQWQNQAPVYATPGNPSYPAETPPATPAVGTLPQRNIPAPTLEPATEVTVPDLRGTSSSARLPLRPRRVCYLPE